MLLLLARNEPLGCPQGWKVPSISVPGRFVERPKRTKSMTNKENRAGGEEEFALDADIAVYSWITK